MYERAIICVDDEEIILESLERQLKKNFRDEYIYEFARDSEEAWEIISELKNENINISMIISDWLMPGVRGDEFLISTHQKFPDIVKVMLTGFVDNDSVARVKEKADLFRCLSKPWNEDDFVQTVKEGMLANKPSA